MKEIKRGQIYYADLSPVVGSEQGGHRPVLIIQNDVGNRYAPTVIVAIITTRKTKANLPTHIWLNAECGLPRESMVECEQVRTLDKRRLKEFMGQVSAEVMKEIDKGLKISFALR
jgi:mRNA interferase MazF